MKQAKSQESSTKIMTKENLKKFEKFSCTQRYRVRVEEENQDQILQETEGTLLGRGGTGNYQTHYRFLNRNSLGKDFSWTMNIFLTSANPTCLETTDFIPVIKGMFQTGRNNMKIP